VANKDHSIEGNTDVPAGLDVVPSVPGTYVGGHDMQGADGTVRTDRPGEILGSPIPKESRTGARAKDTERADYVTSEIDRANREELPLLGGTVDDGWVAGDSKGSKAKTAATAPAARTTDAAPVARAEAAPVRTTETAKAAPAHGSGITVKPGIEK
jgi:hypothetical protein